MHFRSTLLVLAVNIFLCQSASLRLYFSKCAYAGFTCILLNGKYKITYQCPSGVNDVTLYLWDFRSPSNLETMTIKNCTTLRLSFAISQTRPLTHFYVANITELQFIPAINPLNPPNLFFENIHNLEDIPGRTFVIRSTAKTATKMDFESLYFKRVNIGTISPHAFSNLMDVHNFTWNEVNVKRIQHLGIQLEFNRLGILAIRHSNIEIMENLAFKIQSHNVEFVSNKFTEIFPSGINGTLKNFTFIWNSVNNLQPHAISILTENVLISDNKFEYLRSGALEKISPGLLKDSQRNFGSLRFVYEFSHNFVNFMDAGSLNPDVAAYENVATDLKFTRNYMYCSCENLGWLLSETGHGYSTNLLEDFYQTIIEDEFKNTCAHTSCEAPVKSVRKLMENGRCIQNATAEILCAKIKSTPDVVPQVVTRKAPPTSKTPPSQVKKLPLKSGGTHVSASFTMTFIVSLHYSILTL